MKKVLFIATVVKKHINVFHIPYLKLFKEKGWETCVCARNDYEQDEECIIPYCDKHYDMPFERSPFKLNNLKVYREIRKLINKECYDIVHCHTPVGGVVARLATVFARKKGTRVIYTAHGFHFYKGAPLLNWLLYFPMEWICSFFTDDLITINKDDYNLACKYMHAKNTHYIPGIGFDYEKYNATEVISNNLRNEYGIPSDAFVVLSVGEVNKNKNHKVILDAINKIDNENIYYVICGAGNESDNLRKLANEYGIEDRLKLVGYQNNINEWLSMADIFAFPTIREGLGLAAIEAMAMGAPLITSNSGGICDYMWDNECGFSCKYDDVKMFARNIEILYNDAELRKCMGKNGKERAKQFDIKNVVRIMEKIYGGTLYEETISLNSNTCI